MKNYTFIIIVLLCNLHLFPQNIEWEKTYGGSGMELMYTVQQTNDGGYIFGGFTTSSNGDISSLNGLADIWLVKTDESGNLQWEKNYGGTHSETLFYLQQTSDSGYIIGGYSESNDVDLEGNFGWSDFWFGKLDLDGNIEWEKNLGGSQHESITTIEIINDGYILGGYTESSDGDVSENYGDRDFWVIKIDTVGNIVWEKNFGGSSYDYLSSIEKTNDGGYILGGSTKSNDVDVGENYGNHDFWVVKIDAVGNIVWEKNFGGSKDDFLAFIQQTNDGGFILSGSTQSSDGDITNNKGLNDYWMVKIDGLGNLEWEKNFGGSDNDFLSSIEQTNDNGYFLCGLTYSSDGDVTTLLGSGDFWVIKTDSIGNLEWEKTFGDALYNFPSSGQQTTDGGYILGGFGDTQNNAWDFLAYKITGDSDCMGIVDGPNTLDECGICDDNPNNDNATCTDCAGIINGSNTLDQCGICDDNPNNDNATCTDCAGIINGTNALDHCEVCDDDPNNDNITCTDCFGLIDGPNTLDACGVCDDDPSNDNLTCSGYAIISSNTPDLDFGKVELMGIKSMPLNIQNLGEQPLSITNFIFDDPAFYAEINEISLDELSDTTVTIYFNPNEIKNYENQLTLESNAGELNVNLFGEGVLETSINEMLHTNLTISPNPSNGIFTINFDGLETTINQIKVYDVAGRCILDQPFNSQNTIDLSTKAAGIYYLYLQTNNGIIVEKLIKK